MQDDFYYKSMKLRIKYNHHAQFTLHEQLTQPIKVNPEIQNEIIWLIKSMPQTFFKLLTNFLKYNFRFLTTIPFVSPWKPRSIQPLRSISLGGSGSYSRIGGYRTFNLKSFCRSSNLRSLRWFFNSSVNFYNKLRTTF